MSARFSPNGHPSPGSSGQTYGADVRLATSRFSGGSTQLRRERVRRAKRQRPASRTEDWSYGFSADYPNDKIDAQIAFTEIQENFRPALGFVQRDNVRLLRVGASYNPRPRFLNIQQMFHDVYFTRFIRLDNEAGRELGSVHRAARLASPIRRQRARGASTSTRRYERLFEPFEIAPGVILPPGEYRFTRFIEAW